MRTDRYLLAFVWLATAAAVAAGALVAYHYVTRADELAGRRDPADLFADPTLLFTEPGILGSAVELQVTDAVAACMAERGFDYRGPAQIADLAGLLDPAADGYGIAAGPAVPRPRLGTGGPGEAESASYEAALYGSALAGADGAVTGCAAAGLAALDAARATLESLPYSLEQLEADAYAHPAWQTALAQWSACMAERGYAASSPEDLIAARRAALALASGEALQTVAQEEREAAAADFACRRTTLDPALGQVAADLAPAFVEGNRAQLEALLPSGAATEALGTGDVQVTLRWASTVDLDLSVLDPSSDSIDYYDRTSASGGQLDRDANYPCDTATTAPVENVFWPPAQAPAGRYRVTVTYRSTCGAPGPESFELLIRLDGEVVEDIRQTIAAGEQLTFDFSYRGGS